jgi:hypothetical protein
MEKLARRAMIAARGALRRSAPHEQDADGH